MKKFAFLLAAMALIACSESENVAEADDLLAQEESSSSIDGLSSSNVDEQSSSTVLSSATGDVPLSITAQSSAIGKTSSSSSVVQDGKSSVAAQSSSGAVVLSSGNEKQVPSSSNYLDFLVEGVPGGGGCFGYGGTAGGAGGFAGGTGSDEGGFRPSYTTQNYAQIVYARTEKLAANGVAAADVEKKAKEELVIALGLDTLFRENPLQGTFAEFTRSNVEYALEFFFAHDTVIVHRIMNSFAEKGTLDPSEYCDIWNSTSQVAWGEGMTDVVYIRPYIWAKSGALQGCAMTGYESVPPTYIFNNLYSKCVGLPYCDGKNFGSIQRAGLKNIINDTLYYCDTYGWTFLNNFEQDTKDVPCDKIGKVIKSSSLNERYYVCKDGGWNVATKMDYEVQDIACGDSAKLVKSPTDTTKYYLCKDSKWKIATQMEISTTEVPCDRIGKMVDSGTKDYKGQIFYICRDTGWDTATQREADVGDRACDADGKTVKGIVDTNMTYVCHQNVWADFYDAPCDTEGERIRDWKEGLKEDYICYNGKWYYSRNWSCDLPKEYYFNPNVQYGTLMDERDGESYRTVEVNGYTWMAENLRYATIDATQSIPVQEGCEIAGRFYSKDAAKTVCPAGWKLPDSIAVNSLEKGYDRLSAYLQNCFNQQLMSQIGSICSGFECNAYGTSFLSFGTSKNPNDKSGTSDAYYWASDRQNPDDVWIFHIGFNDMICYRGQKNTDILMTVRCIKEAKP